MNNQQQEKGFSNGEDILKNVCIFREYIVRSNNKYYLLSDRENDEIEQLLKTEHAIRSEQERKSSL